jgi:hypothetical protein
MGGRFGQRIHPAVTIAPPSSEKVFILPAITVLITDALILMQC